MTDTSKYYGGYNSSNNTINADVSAPQIPAYLIPGAQYNAAQGTDNPIVIGDQSPGGAFGSQSSYLNAPSIPTTLNSTNTQPSPSINLPPVDTTSTASGLNTSVTTPIQSAESIINEGTVQTPAEAKQQAILDKIASLTGSSQSQTELTNTAEKAAGLPALSSTINDLYTQQEGLNNQDTALQNETLKGGSIENQANNQAIGVTGTFGVNANITKALRDNQIKRAAIASSSLTVKSMIFGALGKYNLAKDAADKAATAQYEAQQRQLDTQKAQLDALLPTLNKEEKAQAAIQAARLADRQDKLDQAKEAKKTILALATAAITNNPDNPQAQYAANEALTESNKQNPDLSKIISLIGKYQKDPVAAKQALLQTQLTQAQINKANAEAEKARTAINSEGDTVESLAQQLVNGTLAPAELSKRATGQASYNSILVAAGKLTGSNGKPFDIAKADRDYKYANNPNTLNTLNYLKSLVGTSDSPGNLGELKVQSDALSRTKFPALNKISNWEKLETGDPSIAAYHATLTEVSDQIAKILQGGGTGSATSDAKLAQATKLFNSNFSKAQIDATIAAIQPLLTNRAKALIGNNPYLSDYNDLNGLSSGTVLKSPDGTQQVNSSDLTAAELAEAKASGWK